jgi:FMN phosphatase YigB (HAD superfamily)
MLLSGPLAPTAFDAIIFDLGGVILPLSYGRTIDGLSALLGRDAREIYQETSQESLFDRFERGEIGQEVFRDSLRALARGSRPPTDEELNQAWNAILEEIPEENVALLRGLSRAKRTFLLSNTNEIHLAKFEADYEARHGGLHGPFWTLFEKDYYSHRIGLRKPDRAAFLHIIDGHGLRPERTLFIDDNHHNVDAALALGMSAILHPRNEKIGPSFEGWLDSSELAF